MSLALVGIGMVVSLTGCTGAIVGLPEPAPSVSYAPVPEGGKVIETRIQSNGPSGTWQVTYFDTESGEYKTDGDTVDGDSVSDDQIMVPLGRKLTFDIDITNLNGAKKGDDRLVTCTMIESVYPPDPGAEDEDPFEGAVPLVQAEQHGTGHLTCTWENR